MNFNEELAKFVFTSKYARFNSKLKRRETWEEAVSRLEDMHLKRFRALPKEDRAEIKEAFDFVREKRVVPSMRSLQFGGKAIEHAECRIYNCAVKHVDSLRSFSEIFYMLLCGNGVGIGVSKKYLRRLPDLVEAEDKTGTVLTYVVQDTIEGWADSVEALLSCYFRNTPYTGRKIVFDYSRIRPAGTPLKTSGGKAPGYKGLKSAHKKIKHLLDTIIEIKHQRQLKSINAYDILMHCSDAVLSGGIRRSATSVIFDADDEDMLNAKIYYAVKRKKQFELDKDTGKYEGYVQIDDPAYPDHEYIPVTIDEYEYALLKDEKKIGWHRVYPHRARSNNSVLLLRSQVTQEQFEQVFKRTKQFGEPGFVFANHPDTLFNPCFEIGFIPVTEDGVTGVQFCNLTSINGSRVTSEKEYYAAAKAAAIIGTLQAAYTYFPYLSNAAKWLTEDEALLGVSMTGIMDNPQVLLVPEFQENAAQIVVDTNKVWANKLGIKQAARTTCVKPEGTSSLVLEAASGAHAWHARRFWRRVQVNKMDPVYRHFKKTNPHMCEESVWSANKTDDVIMFPTEVKPEAMVKADLTALRHLEIIKDIQKHWVLKGTTEANRKDVSHNVSCTVIVDVDEWDEVLSYLFSNKEYFSAVSFLAKTGDKDFQQPPLEAIQTPDDEKLWGEIVKKFAPVDYTSLTEEDDQTALQQELVCAGGQCELPILSN
jgi:ribonucleoside-triphosphate reductase